MHLTLLPFIKTAGEMKTKPTQHSVKELRSIGIQPDVLLCRCEQPIPAEEKRKIGLFCNVRPSAVIQALDAPTSTACRSTTTPRAWTRRCWTCSASTTRHRRTCRAGNRSPIVRSTPTARSPSPWSASIQVLKDATNR
ncbi:MAG: hypothetical protein WDM85_12525 [Caulobacteraceae bacterium]